MSFILANFSRIDVNSQTDLPRLWQYYSAADSIATISASAYFNDAASYVNINDLIFITGSDAQQINSVQAISPNVTTSAFAAAGTIGTSNINNNAVTYAKIQQVAADSLVGNPTSGLANSQGITLGNGLEFTGTTLDVPNTNLIYAAVPISAAEWNGMYAAPKLLVAAPGANKLVVVNNIVLAMTFVSAQYAAGGAVIAQYDSTVHGAGTNAGSATIAAATVTGLAASSSLGITAFTAATAYSTSVNKGVYLSNATAAFTTGDGTWIAHVWYRIVASV